MELKQQSTHFDPFVLARELLPGWEEKDEGCLGTFFVHKDYIFAVSVHRSSAEQEVREWCAKALRTKRGVQ